MSKINGQLKAQIVCVYVCSISAGVKTLVLLTFCDEGDNTQDALDLVTYLNTMSKWIPRSSSEVVRSAVLIHRLNNLQCPDAVS